MTMILSEKYFFIDKYYKVFITNRLLRLYPMYIVVFLLCIAYSLAIGVRTGNFHQLQPYIDHSKEFKATTLVYLIGSNIGLLGQDIVMFLKTNQDGGLQFTSRSFSGTDPLFKYLLIPQAWTLSLEIGFYLVCPIFIKMKNETLLMLLILLIIFKSVAAYNGLSYDPWTYRFFPFELIYFFSGILSYRLYQKAFKFKMHIYAFVFLIIYLSAFTLFFKYLPFQPMMSVLYLLSIAAIVPLLFKYSKNLKIDRQIGELSYPFYISHVLFLDISNLLIRKINLTHTYDPLVALILTILFSVFLQKYVGRRLEDFRNKRIIIHNQLSESSFTSKEIKV